MQAEPGTGFGHGRAVAVSALGVPVVVDACGGRWPELAAALTEAWDWCSPDETSTREAVHVTAALSDDAEWVGMAQEQGTLAGTDLDSLMEWLTAAVTTAAISARAGELLMLHGCAVADPATGATAVLVGPSGAGKTTAATTLGTRFAYLTDETAAVDEGLTVLPYPKPLSLRLDDGRPGKVQVSPGRLGLVRLGAASPRVGAVFLLERSDDGPTEPEVAPVRTVEALALLGEQSSFLAEMRRPLQRLAELAHAVGGVKRIRYRDSGELVAYVGRALAVAR